MTWDHIVVGAGSAGCVMAARLSATGARVLLLEAGDDQPAEDNPLRDAGRLILQGYNWDHRANLRTADAGTSRALWTRFPYSLGKVVGGSSAVNGAIAMRALPRDLAGWAAAGNPDWSWEKVVPYYDRLETDGLPIRRPGPEDLHELETDFWHECNRLDLPDLPDLNAGAEEGVGPVPANAVNGVRQDAATVYLDPVRDRPNLELRTRTQAVRVLFEGTRATAVELDDHTIERTRNVVLCAGAVGTPPILQRSGVCSADLAKHLGVDQVLDLPGVGERLADHPSVVIWSIPRPGVCRPGRPWRQVAGRMSSEFDDDVDVQVGLLNNVASDTIPGFVDRLKAPMAVGLSVMLMRPKSTGHVRARSLAPDQGPEIVLGMGGIEEDVNRLICGVRKGWRILRSPKVTAHLERTQFWTDRMIGNDRTMRAAVRNIMNPGWHAMGTCRMGPATDPMAVVGQDCRVHGLENVRIVDASVFPAILSVPTNLTTLMLAERVSTEDSPL
ncbi:GMC family oxidoreductase [Actinomadura sp. KC216]|uniref:GMC family oxidoreductase n=1 Tax=Actinomadura sp. KC216 TaxID=2530370 RepID=UPI00104316A2|nr:GMC family oxidoreductase [Actinomadura sp. KC216]TDB76607.1 GMC family oxidoreductase [Actinomadura sp. KC216]